MTSTKQSKTKYDTITEKRKAIGARIKKARETAGFKTQQQLADAFSEKLIVNGNTKDSVSYQTISYWENGSFLPSSENLILLSEVLGVTVSSLVEDHPFEYETNKIFYDVDRTYKRIETLATNDLNYYKNTIKALPFAKQAHDNWNLKNSDIPYLSHPLTMATHILAMGIKDDAILAATLLHDVIEDCCIVNGEVMTTKIAIAKKLKYRPVLPTDLPVDEETRELVSLMTHEKCDEEEKREKMLEAYYAKLAKNPKAALIKLVDRCNNISKMAWGLSHERIHRMIHETDVHVLKLLDSIKNGEYDNAAYLLSYQMKTTLDIYKRLM